jgi:membrane-bound lytic murein transglycosylase D
MAIRRRFHLSAVVFLALFTPGATASIVFASSYSEPFSDAPVPELEHAPVPPTVFDPPDLLGEQSLDGVGSVAEQDAPSPTDLAGIEMWEGAFAESGRAVIVAVAPKPAYPVVMNHQVQTFLDRFTGARREVVHLWVGRASRYLGMIRGVLRDRGLPEELAYTAMIESGFNPVAVSRMGAKGLWQFMAGTARRYGLRVDQWIDERLDPEKSTHAAAAYLRDLYSMFGSWALAQAAYNAGEMKVVRAIRATGSSDFWTLANTNHLKPETKDFVPAIQAATLIAQDPTRYGFEFTKPAALELETVAVPPSTDLRRLAPRAGVSVETLRTLNPVLVRGVTPPGHPWKLTVPSSARESVLAALAPPAPKRQARPAGAPGAGRPVTVAAGQSIHVVRPRDTVSSIAKRYGISTSDVLRWNDLEEQDRIKPGDRLRIADVGASVERDGQGGFR